MKWLVILALALAPLAPAQTPAPAPEAAPAPGKTDKLPFVHVDVAARRVVVDCQAVNAEHALEFLCVTAGTAEHETVLRTRAKPSDIHLGLLMIGLKPGEPIRYAPATEQWLPPAGPPLQISVAFEKEGKPQTLPAWKLFREMKSKNTMPPRTWIFAGSRVLDSGQYAADTAGYVVTIVNFDLALIDVPFLASSSNELLEYELDPAAAPPTGAPVKMIIEPAGALIAATQPASATRPAVTVDQAKIDRLREQWLRNVSSHAKAVQDAATEHYRIILELRAEQNRLIDEAERVRRTIEQLEREYQDMTVPRPAQEQP